MVYAPCFQKTVAADGTTFVDDKGEVTVLKKSQADELYKVTEAQLEGADNVCALDEVSPPALLHTVRVRFLRAQIYTRVSRILIAVNPFKFLDIYSAKHVATYRTAADSMDCPAHIYCIGQDAVIGMRSTDMNQAVLISGESGAGKTESTKLVLSFVAESLSSGSGGVLEKIQRTNPILESFGNAMTVRNNNSSRFGKFLEISICPNSKQIQSCSVKDFLLEITRVTSPGATERNYHVFFQLCVNRDSEALKEFNIKEAKSYVYLKHCLEKAPGVDDVNFFEELVEAFKILNFNAEMRRDIFSTIAGILSIGNCSFVEGADEARLVDESTAAEVAKYWSVDPVNLVKAMTLRKISVGKEVTESPRTPAQAKAARDALAKLIYGKLFKFLIVEINNSFSDGAPQGKNSQSFGVLDIAGFESFQKNSLEQLHINLSNEYLQQHFNNHIFKMEMDDYVKEGIDTGGGLSFNDNKDILALIVAKGGVFTVLDEQTALPKGSDTGFMNALFKAQGKHARLIVPKVTSSGLFGIKHFAGDVMYSVDAFLEKNLDKPPPEAADLCNASSCSVINKIGAHIVDGGGKSAKTVSASFRNEMSQLMERLQTAQPHYVRCVKPNPQKVPDVFDAKLTLEQLTSSGVMEAVHIRQQGFAARIPFAEFEGRFLCILDKQARLAFQGKTDIPERAKMLVKSLPPALGALGGISPGEIVAGKSKVFIKSRVSAALEKARDLCLQKVITKLQCCHRGAQVRKRLKTIHLLFAELESWRKANNFYSAKGSEHTAVAKLKTADALDAAIEEGVQISQQFKLSPFGCPKSRDISSTLERMRAERSILSEISRLSRSLEPVEISSVLSRAAELEMPQSGATEALSNRANLLKAQLPLAKAMRDALSSSSVDDMTRVYDAYKNSDVRKNPDTWIEELDGVMLAGQLFQRLEDVKSDAKRAKVKQDQADDLKKGVLDAARTGAVTIALQAEEEEEEEKPKQRKTITGLDATGQGKILMSLMTAAHEYDVDVMKTRLAEAVANGIEAGNLKEAQSVFESLSTEAGVSTAIEACLKKLKAEDGTENAQVCLRNLIRHATNMGFASDAASNAGLILRSDVRRRARETIKVDMFHRMSVESLAVLQGAFANVEDYKGLRDPTKWHGDRAWMVYMTKGGAGAQTMLSHSNEPITMTLTKVERRNEGPSIEAFRDILGWMCDRSVPEVQRCHLDKAILETASSDQSLADEIFVQMLKQLNRNPSMRSSRLGWNLFLRLCQHVTPSEELEGFVRAFVLREIASGEFADVAKQCIADLNVTAAPSRVIGEDSERIPVQISLPDHSSRKIYVHKDALLKDVADEINHFLHLKSAKEFSLFQHIQGMSHERLLPDSIGIFALLEKWAKLQQQSGRKSGLVYKRRYFRRTELLNIHDSAHADITYRQALSDYLNDPILESVDAVIKIAATIVCTEPDYFLSRHQGLHSEGVLEHLIPKGPLDDVSLGLSRMDWAKKIHDVCKDVQPTIYEDENLILKHQRILSLLAGRKLYGMFHWFGKQRPTIPTEKVSIIGAPETTCVVNPKAPKNAQYYLCVDLTGILFISKDKADGKHFFRNFHFTEEALDRVLHWAAKEDWLQIVVQTMDPADPQKGRRPATIHIESPASADIGYFITRMSIDAKALLR
eukprot:TRINITY_DN17297_c0_g2_i1.p1 TRINITY_DN17297_c0_g2~~TRINITY_DN17297_c0_g2_i1.p1  ORF type:complete len:1696 (+),score=293.59 TRINITY_DN17297_c0_g2_i1:138-5090(+)